MSEKRTLCQLLRRDNNPIYVYIKNESLWDMFIHQAISEGFQWQDGSPMGEKRRADIVALSNNMTVRYIGGIAPHMMLHNSYGRHIRIDFARFINYAEDYEYWPLEPARNTAR